MGCCVSTNRSYSSASSNPPSANGSENRAPPPPEEETVKEVLSETPKFQPHMPTETRNENLFTKPEEISEVSKVCSVSESVSTLPQEKPRQRINKSPAKVRKTSSFSGENGGTMEMTSRKSPTRRPEQSPGKRNIGSVRIVQMSNGERGNQDRGRNSGENSGRRYRSPSTLTDRVAGRSVVGRSPSKRRTATNQSPAEKGGRKMENCSMDKWPTESMENPLVSLECFIFL